MRSAFDGLLSTPTQPSPLGGGGQGRGHFHPGFHTETLRSVKPTGWQPPMAG